MIQIGCPFVYLGVFYPSKGAGFAAKKSHGKWKSRMREESIPTLPNLHEIASPLHNRGHTWDKQEPVK